VGAAVVVGTAGVFTGGGGVSPRQVVVIALSGCAQLITPSIVIGISLASAGPVFVKNRQLEKMAVTENTLREVFIVVTYFFLYPVGHLGFVAVIFLVILPFAQVIVDLRIETGDGVGNGVTTRVGDGLGEGVAATFSWVNFSLIVGCEKVKLYAPR